MTPPLSDEEIVGKYHEIITNYEEWDREILAFYRWAISTVQPQKDMQETIVRRLVVRVGAIEGLLVQLAQATWESCGTDFAQKVADCINEANEHLRDKEQP